MPDIKDVGEIWCFEDDWYIRPPGCVSICVNTSYIAGILFNYLCGYPSELERCLELVRDANKRNEDL